MYKPQKASHHPLTLRFKSGGHGAESARFNGEHFNKGLELKHLWTKIYCDGRFDRQKKHSVVDETFNIFVFFQH